MTDIITRHCDLMAQITDSPRDYQEAVALHMVSTFAGTKFRPMSLDNLPYNRKGDRAGTKLLNLWFILLGRSRVSHRTTAVVKAMQAEDDIAPDIRLTQTFTPEYVQEALSGRDDTMLSWIQDECLQFFTELQKKDYMKGTDSLLSALYDGIGYSRGTRGGGKKSIPPGSSLTILLNSTEFLPSTFYDGQFRQGFLNRFMFVWPNLSAWSPKKRSMPSPAQTKEVDEILEWMDALFHYDPGRSSKLTIVEFTKDANKLLEDYDHTINDRIRADSYETLKSGWLGNAENQAERLAAIYRISRLSLAELKSVTSHFLYVEEQDVLRAFSWMKKAEQWTDRVLEAMQISQTDRELRDMCEALTKHGVKNTLNSKYEIGHSKLMQLLHKKSPEMKVLIETAIDRGLLTKQEIGQGTSKAVLYVLN